MSILYIFMQDNYFCVKKALLFPIALCLATISSFAVSSLPDKEPSTLSFTENKGQWNSGVAFISDLSAGKLVLQNNRLGFLMWDGKAMGEKHHGHPVNSINAHFFTINFVGILPSASVIGVDKQPSYKNYFLGNDPSKWASRVAQYKVVKYQNLWNGIDAQLSGNGDGIEYSFEVKAGANPNDIKLRYEGVEAMYTTSDRLYYKTSVGEFTEKGLFAYQIINGEVKAIPCFFLLDEATHSVSFSFPQGYNRQYSLTIDPTMVFSSYTGSTADNWGYTATYDQAGNMYVGGYVNASDIGTSYPTTTGAFQVTWGGGTGGNIGNGNGIAFACDMGITKFNATGTTPIYSTYLGGNDNETPHSLIVDPNDNLIIYGVSYSANYPVSAQAYDRTINGMGDIVVTKLNAAGSALIGSTFIGGLLDDGINFDPQEFSSGNLKWNYGDQNRGEVVIDNQGNIYIASCTKSSDFPTTPNAPQRVFGGLQDGCIFKLTPNLLNLTYSTYAGGNNDDACYSIDLTAGREAYICGGTMSSNFPVTNGTLHSTYQGGTFDGFLLHLNTTGSQFLQSTFLGTSGNDQVYFVKLDSRGDVYVVGQTTGIYPVTNATYSNANSGQFIAKLRPDLTNHIYSTVFGNGVRSPNISPTAFLVDTCENVYVSGWGCASGSFGPFTRTMTNMPLSTDALQRTTDGTDFYFFVLQKNAQSLLYGSYFGGNGAIEHVDGGTSRFDSRGVIYEAICAACGGNSLTPTTPGVWSPTNQSANCNLLGLKMAFNLAGTFVEIDAQPRATGCVPLTVQFSSNGSTAQSLTWHFDDGDSSTVANPVHTFTDTGIYHVMLIGIDSSSCNINDTAFVDVWVRDDSLIADFMPSFELNCDSNKVYLSSLNHTSTNYSWSFGDGTSGSGDSVTHVYVSSGSYNITLVVTDTTKCNLVDTFSSSITIPGRFNASFNMNDSSGCIPLSINFQAQGTGSAHYLWNFDDGDTSTFASVTHVFTTQDTFDVSLVVVDSTYCNVADTVYGRVITIDSSANADFIFSRIFSGCDSVEVIAWSTYVGEETELWDFGDGTTATTDSVRHVYHTPGIYTITHVITDNDVVCRELDTTRILVSLLPLDITVTIADTAGCTPLTSTFTGNSTLTTTTYEWFWGDGNSDTGRIANHTYNTAGNYTVTMVATDTNACVSTDTVFATVTTINDSAIANFSIDILNDCDSNLVINLNNESTNAVNYFWSLGDGTTSTQQQPGHTYNLPGTYTITLIVSDTARCNPYDTAQQTVTMFPNFEVNFSAFDVCLGAIIDFTNLSDPNAVYFWSFGDGSTSGSFSTSNNYNNPGTYQVSLVGTDSSSCNIHDTATHTVTVFEQPIAGFTTDGDTFKFEKPVLFSNTSQFYTNLHWDFGDGFFAEDAETPTHTYELINEVTICVTAYNPQCADTFCRDIFISYKALIGVPNAFTPNGDGINDVVKIEGAGIVELVFRIYNRWGEKVFETNDKNIGWDGIFRGELQEMDAYTYAADATLINGEIVHLKGNITLLR